MSVPQEGVFASFAHRRRIRAAGAVGLALCVLMHGCASGPARVASPVRADVAAERNVPGGGTDGAVAAAPRRGPARIHLGESVRGTPIVMDLFGDGPDRILIVGGIHGDESNGAQVAERLVDFLRARPELTAGRTIGIVARVNPDGLHAGTRTNAHGVDLNRNFPTRDWRPAEPGEFSHGGAPRSEPETRAIVAAVERVRPRRLIDVHSISAGEQCNNYDGAAREIAVMMSSLNGYPVSSDIGYPTPGALGCWAGLDLKVPAITLELPREAGGGACWRDNAEALLAAIRGIEETPIARTPAGVETRETTAAGRK
jgi:murein peptide amidase A